MVNKYPLFVFKEKLESYIIYKPIKENSSILIGYIDILDILIFDSEEDYQKHLIDKF
jgi:hypothetical protein